MARPRVHRVLQWLGVRPLAVAREEAIRVAVEAAAARNLRCTRPEARREGLTWFVMTAPEWMPTAYVVVDGNTGEVLDAGCPEY
jgi:hypothetical protein